MNKRLVGLHGQVQRYNFDTLFLDYMIYSEGSRKVVFACKGQVT